MDFSKIGKPKYLVDYIVIINIAVFVLGSIIEMATASNLLVELGAKINFKIADHQYYRLVTPMFLHADVVHLLFNSLALFNIGRPVETVLGKWRFLAIYIFSVIFGTMGSFVFNDSISVGASGGIFGLIGAMLFLSRAFPDTTKKLIQKDVISLIVINLILGFTNPRIDNEAHIAGLIGGIITSYAIGFTYVKQSKASKYALRGLIVVLIGSFFAMAVPNYRSSEEYFVSKGLSYYYDKDYENALTIFKSGSEMFPENDSFKDVINALDALVD